MTGVDDAVLRLRPLGTDYRTVGTAEARGVWTEGVSATSNLAGSDSLDCVLHRDIGQQWFDAWPFVQAELEVAGSVVWGGRMKGNPSRASDQSWTLNMEGWQYHLDDDLVRKVYVHTRMSEWKDQRSFTIENLGNYRAGAQVANDRGNAAIMWPNGFAAVVGDRVGIFLDLGPGVFATRAVVQWARIGPADGNTSIICRGFDGTGALANAAANDAFSVTLATASGPSAGNFTTASRYVGIYCLRSVVGALGADVGAQISSIQIFTSTAYESGNASILKADQVIKDCLPSAPLFDQRTDLIAAGTFSIPDFQSGGYRTPRDVMVAAAAVEDNLIKVSEKRALVFKARPVTPSLVVGDWAGFVFDDAGLSADGALSGIIAEAQGVDGTPLVSTANAVVAQSGIYDLLSAQQPSNGLFETNTTGWSIATGSFYGTGTLVWDNAAGDQGSAGALRVDASVAGPCGVRTQLTLVAGRTYQLRARFKTGASFTAASGVFGFYLDQNLLQPLGTTSFTTNAGYTTMTVTLTAAATLTSCWIAAGATASAATGNVFWLDFVQVFESRTSLVDKWGFTRRLAVQLRTAMTQASLNQVAAIYAKTRTQTPFRGKGVAYVGGVRQYPSFMPLHPAQLLTLTGENVLFLNRVNPDTGGIGRISRLVNVRYNHDARYSELDFDSSATTAETFLERIQVASAAAPAFAARP